MTGRDRQSVADMAMEHSGSIEGMFRISRENGIPMDAETSGMVLKDTRAIDEDAASLYARKKHSPATHYPSETQAITDESGENITTDNLNILEYEI